MVASESSRRDVAIDVLVYITRRLLSPPDAEKMGLEIRTRGHEGACLFLRATVYVRVRGWVCFGS